MLRNNHSHTMIGFFTCTGASYANTTQPKACIQLPDDRFQGSYNHDQSFADLTDMLDFEFLDQERDESPQHVYGYNGCGKRGGHLFAYGVDEPAEHLYQQVLTQVKTLPQGKKLKLVLIGHSRGAFSAILLAKKIKTHPQLKKQVEVILDLRDPVPGNLHHFAEADFAHTTLARQLYDLTDCFIDEVHVTVQERSSFAIGSDILVPCCHPKTKLQVEMMPGVHEIQSRRCYQPFIHPGMFNNDALLTEHPKIYLIGLLKSLQIMHEQGAPINYDACIGYLHNFLRGIPINNYYQKGERLLPAKTISLLFTEHLPQSSLQGEKYDATSFAHFLKMVQLHLYDALLLEFKAPDTLPKHKRELHFGGQFGLTASDPNNANCFNMRHAALIQEMKNDLLDPPAPDYYPKPLLGFKTRAGEKPWKKRIDLNNARFIKIPNNLFQQKYQRIMLVLDQQIKTDLIIPNSKPKLCYSDAIKRKLFAIANEKITDRQKLLAMETFLIEIYWDVRANEGLFDSRLRRGLEWILSSPLFLNIKGRYGLSFPEKPENTTRYRENLFNLSHRVSNGHRKFANTAENHPAFYQHSIKFLIGLEHIKFKTKRKKEVSQLITMVNDLLIEGNTSNQEVRLFETFQIKLLTLYNRIRQHESGKLFSYFRASKLGNFIEKFLREELKIKDIPHGYNAAQIDNIIVRLTQLKITPSLADSTSEINKMILPLPTSDEMLENAPVSALEEDSDDYPYSLVPDDEDIHSHSEDEPSDDAQPVEIHEVEQVQIPLPEKPVVIVLYYPQHGTTNTDKLIAFYSERQRREGKQNVEVLRISPEDGEKHPIFQNKERISGIILPGGLDIPPNDDDIRKKFEIYLLNLACEENRKIPLLGICRGHQLIASQFGADIQNIGNISHNNRNKLLYVKNVEGSFVHERVKQKYEKFEAIKAAGKIENTILTKNPGEDFGFYTVCAHSQWALFGSGKVNRFPNKKVIVTVESGHGVPEGLQIDDHILTYQHHHEAFWENHGKNGGKVARALLKQFATMVNAYFLNQKDKPDVANKSFDHGM